MSQKAKFFVFVLFIGFALIFLFYLIGIPFGWGVRIFVITIAIILYALLTRIAEKLRQN